MGARRFPIWPGVVLLAGSVLCFGIACSIFNHAQQKDVDEIAAAANVHNHALATYNQKCRPATRANYAPCLDYFHALQANETAISRALNAVSIGRADLQMRDLRASVKRLEECDGR